MAAVSVPDFLEICRTSRLLTPTQLDELKRAFPEQPSDPKALARDLMQRGWLTTWQVNHLLQGRGTDLLLGSYVLLQKLGEGGTGTVYKARNWKLGRIAAVKVIRPERLDNETMIRRFRREIEAAAQLSHPNIVHAFDADEVGGTHFFVMEYVEGHDLSRVVKERGPLPVVEACEYIRQAALGLQHAFERGMVHRDIKPSNLLLAVSRSSQAAPGERDTASTGTIKLLDMGLARLERPASERSSTLTQEGAVMGTPDYIAPEQARDSHTADIRADLYSLGCTLYFLLSGRVPFPGGTLTEKLLKHLMDAPTPLRQLRADVPAEVAHIVETLMAKRPEERFQTPAELVAALDAILAICERPVQTGEAGQIPDASSFAETLHQGRTAPRSPVNPFADIDLIASATIPEPSRPRRPQAASPRNWQLIAGSAIGVLLSAAVVLALLLPGREAANPVPENLPTKKADESKHAKKLSPRQQEAEDAKQREKAEQKRRADADEALKPLAAKAVAKTPFPDFAKDVATFKATYGGTPAAVKAAEMLMKLPSPLDQLDPKKLQAECIASWRAAGDGPPVEWVGALGEHRGRHLGIVRRVYWHPKGKLIISQADDGILRFWDAPSLLPVRQYRGGPPAFTADGTMYALAENKLCRWDLSKGEGAAPVVVMDAPPDQEAIAVSPDGRLLASSQRTATAISLWDLTTKPPQRRGEIRWDAGHINTMRFDPDSKFLITGSHDKTVRLWDVRGSEPKPSGVLSGHGDWIYDVAISPNGKWIASVGAQDQSARLWSFDGGSAKIARVLPLGAAGCSVAFAPNSGSFAVGLWSGNIITFELKPTGPKQGVLLSGPKKQIWSIAYSPDGESLAAGGEDTTLRSFDVAAGGEVNPPRGAIGYLKTVSFSLDDRLLVAAGVDGMARVWDPVLGNETGRIPCNQAWFLPGNAGYLGIDSRLRWFNLLEQPQREWGPATAVAIANDGQTIAYAKPDATIELVKLNNTTSKPVAILRGHAKQIDALAFSPDGRRLASGGLDETVRLWDLDRHESKEEAIIHMTGTATQFVSTLAFAPDGKTLAIGYQHALNQVRLWDISGPQPKPSPAVVHHSQALVSLAYAPDGRTLVSAGLDGRVIVSDAASGSLLRDWRLPAPVLAVTFAHDGRHFATANGNGTVYIFRIPGDLPRSLSAEEAKQQREHGSTRLGVPAQITNSIGMKLNLIPAGRFLMGSPETEPGRQTNEGPRRLVSITRPFYMAIHEVTNKQYRAVMNQAAQSEADGPQHPVHSIAWGEAVKFCDALSALPAEKAAKRVYRLPTEAEWEYACRAGTQTIFFHGDDVAELGDYAWYSKNDEGGKTHRVGLKKPNSWGLYDMLGNVWEWCADPYQADYYLTGPVDDPPGPASSTSGRVYRGGARSNDWPNNRCATRNRDHPTEAPHGNIGFRVVCDLQPVAREK